MSCEIPKLAASDVALLQAAGADVHLLLMTVYHNRDPLDVGTELAVNRAERVGNGTTGNGMLAADLTNLGHDSNLHRRRLGEDVATDARTHKT